jgi:hypothetical protein
MRLCKDTGGKVLKIKEERDPQADRDSTGGSRHKMCAATFRV